MALPTFVEVLRARAAESPEARAAEPALAALLGSRLADILGVPSGQLAADRPLTASGLDSLRAIELCHAVETELGVALPMAWLLEGATPAELADEVLRRLAEAPAGGESEKHDDGAPAAVSPGQRALWLLDRLAPQSAAYVLAGAARVVGDVDVDGALLHRALDTLAARHPALSTVFAESAGEPVPRPIAGPAVEWLEEDGAAWSDEELARRVADRAYRPFDLAAGPLLRAGLVARGRREPVLWLAVHHIAADFWSVEVLLGELARLYRFAGGAGGAGRAAGALPPAPRPPFATAHRATDAETQRLLAFWRAALAGKPQVLELPTDRPRGRAPSFRGDWRTARLPAELTRRLRQLGGAESATLFVTLAAGFGALLARTSGQDEPLFGTPTSGRGTAELAGAVGYLVNPVVLAADLSGDPSAALVLARMRRTALAAFAHQELPFAILAEQQAAERDPSRSPVFQAMLVLQGGRGPLGERLAALSLGAAGAAGGSGSRDLEHLEPGHLELDLGGLRLAPLPLAPRGAQLDLTLACGLLPGATADGEPAGLAAALTFNADLFDGTTAERLLGHFAALLDGMAANPAARIWELPLLSPAERAQLAAWGGGEGGAPLPQATVCLHELFALQAARTPGATALLAAGEELTYRELARRVAGLAAVLRAAGVAPEVRVGICLERTPAMIVALLAVLAAGGAYVPLDPAYPRDRLAFTAADSGMTVLLTQASLRGRVPEDGLQVIVIEEAAATTAAPAPPRRGARGALGASAGGPLPGNLAYVIYTSGSTGRPKGVAIEHASAVAFVEWARSVFSAEELAGVLAATSICFDLSITEIFVPLASGGAVVLAASVLELPELAAAERVTLIDTVPSAMAELVGGGRVPASVRTVALGGEPLTPSLAEAIRRRTRATRLGNIYGPSECTTCSTWWAAPLAAGGEAPLPTLGRPIAGTRVHLLGPGLAPVPAGVAGEVWIGGRGVSRGYLGRPELTAERFRPDPFAAAPGRRLYRVGDLARWRPDGELEFLGRVDHQVKIRGFRVEPGEVEAALESLPGVGAAAVLARPAGGGELRLVAYAVLAPAAAPGSAPTAESLRRDLALQLPQHLVPAAVVLLPELPRTPNGKLDRRRLPEPEWGDGASAVPPRTPLEARLAGIFGEVLGIAAVSIHDSFFALGGHSLLAARALARVRAELGLELPLRALFESPTVAALALAVERAAHARGEVDQVDGIDGAADDQPPMRSEPRGGPAPLSFAQERLWFLDRLEPGTALYNLPAAVELRGRLCVAALAASLAAIAARHQVLRTSYGERDGQPFAFVAARPVGRLAVVDLAPLAPARRAGEAARLAAAEALRPFDLAAGPPLRTALLRLAREEHVLLATFHHIAADGWSIGVFVRELSALYGTALEPGHLSAGQPSSLADALPQLPLQYADHAARERRELAGAALERQLSYWRQRLAGATAVLDLPTDRPRTAAPDLRGGLRRLTLPAALAADLRALALDHGATLFMVLLAGVESVLGAHCGQDDLLLGTPVANRGRLDVEGLIGLFVNTLVLRADLAGEPTGAELVARAREASLGAFAHQQLPFERLVEALAPQRELGRAPLVQALFALQNAPAERLALPGLAPALLPEAGGLAKLELEIEAEEVAAEGLVLRLRYRRELFDATTIDRLAGHLARRLAGLAAEPGRRAADLPLLAAAERAQLLVEWRDGSSPPSAAAATVVGLFAAQAARTPAAVAVRSGAAAITYGALAARAGYLARRLRRLGVRPGDRVGLCAERSPDLAAGLLAIFQSGGAFLPLDPGYPTERLRFVLADAAPSVVVGEEALLRALPAHGAATLALDTLDAAEDPSAAGAAAETAVLPAASDLAYVIYTSGSTGRPKGVAVEHGSLANLLAASRDQLGWRAGDVGDVGAMGAVGAVVAPFSFDIFLFELLAPLVAGGAAVLVPLLPALDVEALVDGLGELTHLHAVPALMRQVVAAARRRGLAAPRLRTLFVGGDTVPLDLLREMRAAFPAAAIRVLYGPTEATILATSWTIRPGEPPTRSLLGRPLGNVEVGVRDAGGRPQPIGVAGELWIGGAGVAREYLGQPQLTAERFVAAAGRRWYRSGDRARFLATGDLEFSGRLDQQLKIRGFRIEPGEVEAALAEHPAVATALVAAVAGVAAGDGPRLVAYVVPRRDGGDAAALAADLRAHLALRLPAHMVPAAFVALPELPLTSHGKLDLRRLPAPDWQTGETAAPRTPTEELVAGLWSEVLGLPRVGLDDDFFAAGGHSLLATRLVSRLREALGVQLPLRALFESPTVAGLARRLETARRERTAMEAGAPIPPPIPAAPRPLDGTPLPLSFAQERLWFLDRLAPGGSAYNLAAAVRLRGGLEVAALAAAFGEIARRHEVLGATYGASGGTPFQRAGAGAAPELPRIDLGGLPAAAAAAAEADLAAALAARPFDLARGPRAQASAGRPPRPAGLRTVLLRRSAADHLLVATMHHIVSDGWSMGILVHELGALYAAAVARRPSPLAALPIQYADYAAWQRRWMAGDVLAGELAHWRAVLAGLPPALELPADRPRPARQSFRGAERGFALPPALWSALGAAARRSGVTLYMLLLAAFDVLLYRLTGQRDLAVGSPIAGRTRGETEGLIGLFVNTLVLRAEIAADDTLATLLPRLRQTALTAYAHQELPFEKLVEALAPVRDLARSPVVQVMLALQNAPLGALTLPGLTLEPLRLAGRTAKLDLTLSVVEADGGAIGYLEHATDLFDRATIARLAERFAALLAGVAVDLAGAPAGRRLDDLPLLSAAERQQLREWNDTPAWLGECAELAGTTLYQLIAAQVERTPGAVAVSLAGDELTYRQLGDAAQRLARRLAGKGAGPGVLVGLCAERSLELMVGLVAILAAGAAYVPLDPAYPAERLAYMVEDAAVGVLLTHGAAASALPRHRAAMAETPETPETPELPELPEIVEIDLAALLASGPDRSDPPLPAADPDDLAYVIYTSGSTGRPKGAMNSHRAVVNRLLWMQQAFGLTAEDRVLQKTPISFDVSVWEIFWPLLAGARLVLARPGGHQDAAYLAHLVALERITTVHFVPSMLQAFVAAPGVEACTSLRRVVASGEALPRELVRRLAERNPAPLWNLYGPTEAAVEVTFRDCREGAGDGEGGSVPIGRPISGVEIRLLDPSLRPVPVGGAGELAIGGLAPGRGYWRRPDLTAERFVPDPLSALPGARLYRTGDLARFLADGSLDYLGRLDHQVKVRGVRIELGEIEAVLAAHPAVAEAVVMLRPELPGGGLAAYLVPRPQAEPLDRAELRRHLAARLPEAMVPAAFVLLAALPLTPSGKADRRALPAPSAEDRGAGAAVGGVPPRPLGPTEQLLAGIWTEVLRIDAISIDDDFFALGGHSLLAMQVLARLEQVLAVELPVAALFAAPTIAALAARVEAALEEARRPAAAPARAATPPLVARPAAARTAGELPLSFGQERLWFLDRLIPGGTAYNVPVAIRLRGALDTAALAGAFGEIVRRHESLRTTFAAGEGGAWQRVGPPSPAALALIDLGSLPAAAAGAAEADLAAAEAERPFDLARGPLIRTVLLRRSAGDHLLLLTMHHIVSDAWSLGVLVRELGELYAAAHERRPSPLTELPIQYADYAAWQRRWMAGEVLAGELAHWRAALADLPAALELPADRPRPPEQSFRGAERGFALPPALWSALGAAARRSGVTLYMLLLAAFDVLLYRLTGQRDLAVGSPIAGRTRAETFGLIGLFVNTLVLRATVADDDTLATLLPRLRQTALAAYAHQDLPFEKLVEALAPARDLARSPVVQVMLALQNAPLGALTLPGLTLEPLRLAGRAAKLDLTLSVVEADGGAIGYWEHASDLFDHATIARLAERFAALLAGAVVDLAAAGEPRRLDDLPLLSAAERQQLREWNDTPAWLGQCVERAGTTLYGLIAAQIERTPGAVAVSLAGDELTYRQLGDAAERLARRLAGKGVGPGVLVGLCVERSLELMVGLVAILAAGAAYVPLDPAYPAERLAHMVENAAVGVLLTHGAAASALPLHGAAVAETPETPELVEIDLAALLAAAPDRSDLPLPAADPDDLAYVIYTSGSTGRPKGAMNSHRAVVNRLLWMQRAFGLTGEDRVLQKTPISFDVSVWELFWPLLAGARLVLARPGGHQDAAYLAHLVALERITTVHFVPSMLQAFVAAPGVEACTSLRRVVASGEALPRELARRLAERNPAPLWNLYGPTEAAVDVTCRDCRVGAGDGLGGSVPIGRPISGVEIRLLDPSLRPVPVGGAGELAIGGLAPGRGYWRRPDLTAERFVPDPLSALPGARLYRTGDLARFLADGSLDYLGRLDHQVKVRGVRIELGEVEAALAAHPAVAEAVVILRPELPGGGGLVACLTRRDGHADPPDAELRDDLRAFLAARLPGPMIPNAFVLLAAMPLTPTGKLDRRALLATEPGLPGLAAGGYVAPRNPVEALFAGIWAEVLGSARLGRAISVHDNFFELGGNSILSIQIVARAARAGCRITPRQLFEQQTVARLAAVAGTAAEVLASQGPVTGPLPLTPIQRWFFGQDLADPHHFNQAVLLAVREVGPRVAESALGALVRHHDALRLRVSPAAEDGGLPRAENAPPEPCFFLPRVDLTALASADAERALGAAADAAQAGLDLARGPLLRCVWYQLAGGARLLLVIHHLAVDGVSWRILLEDLETACRQVAAGGAAALRLPAKTTSFKEWAERLDAYAHSLSPEAVERELGHWSGLAGLPFERLPFEPAAPNERTDPFDSFASAAATGLVASSRTVTVELDPAETRALLTELPSAYGTQVNDALLAALAATLARPGGALWIDLEGHGREEVVPGVDLSRTVGWFTTLFPVALAVESTAPGALLQSVKEQLRAIPDRGFGHGVLRYLRGGAAAALLAALPAPRVSFNYLGEFDGSFAGGLFAPAAEPSGAAQSPRQRRTHALAVSLLVASGRLRVDWGYSADLCDRGTIERLAAAYAASLRQLIAHCRTAGTVYTPGDFTHADLEADDLANLLAELDEA